MTCVESAVSYYRNGGCGKELFNLSENIGFSKYSVSYDEDSCIWIVHCCTTTPLQHSRSLISSTAHAMKTENPHVSCFCEQGIIRTEAPCHPISRLRRTVPTRYLFLLYVRTYLEKYDKQVAYFSRYRTCTCPATVVIHSRATQLCFLLAVYDRLYFLY